MAETIFRGPGVSLGSLMDTRVESFDGPSISYQGDTIPDPRYSPAAKDGVEQGRIPVFLNSPYIVMVDNIPSTTNASTLVSAAQFTSGVALTIIQTASGATAAGSPSPAGGIPIINFNTGAVTNVLAIDLGFATGTTTANSSTVVVQDSTQFQQAQWLVIGGAGNGA